MKLELLAVEGLPEIGAGADLGGLIAQHAPTLETGDVIVVAQKIVSKAENRLKDLSVLEISSDAQHLASRLDADPRLVQAVLNESVRVVRDDRVLIVETNHGFVCANAGVDRSNIPGADMVSLLPVDCDASADALQRRITEVSGVKVGVVISDTFGRPWRNGLTNVALGVAGCVALVDYRGRPDDFGRPLNATMVAVADEIAGAAELLMGKTRRIPVIVVRGLVLDCADASGTGKELVRPASLDLFR